MKKLLPSIVCGFGAGVLHSVPFIRSLACCLIAPAAAYLSILLFRKAESFTEKIPPSKAAFLGIFTGIFFAFFATGIDSIVTYIFKTNDFVESLPEARQIMEENGLAPFFEEGFATLSKISTDITTFGFSLIYLIFNFLNNLLIGTLFGLIGGLIGMSVTNKKIENKTI